MTSEIEVIRNAMPLTHWALLAALGARKAEPHRCRNTSALRWLRLPIRRWGLCQYPAVGRARHDQGI